MTDFNAFVAARADKATLDGTETTYILDGGVSKEATTQAIADLAGASVGASSTTELLYNNSGSVDGSILTQTTNTISQKNSTNAQTQAIYNTDDGAGNTEYATHAWTANVYTITTAKTGTGTARGVTLQAPTGTNLVLRGNLFILNASGTQSWRVDTNLIASEGSNITAGTTTGTKLGTSTTQKFGFWNATPVVQPATTGTTTGFTAGAGTAVLSDSTFTGNTGSAAYTIGDIVLALKQIGLLAS